VADEYAIEADGLVKEFGDTLAVDDVSFAVPRGSVLGLLGPNGAGKTTTVRMMTTLTRPTRGTARVAGHDVLEEYVGDLAAARRDLAGVRESLRGRDAPGEAFHHPSLVADWGLSYFDSEARIARRTMRRMAEAVPDGPDGSDWPDRSGDGSATEGDAPRP
jgi:ABC-type cobalamin/Fe3+-siderophores transport system ATPase subunit